MSVYLISNHYNIVIGLKVKSASSLSMLIKFKFI